MSRWSPRRAARRPGRVAVVPPAVGWSLMAAALDLPDGCPDDVRALARLAAAEGPRLLEGFSPDAAGLLLVHPDSDACPDATRAAGQVYAAVEPVSELVTLARQVRLEGDRRPGWFLALLIGATHSAVLRLAPLDVATREAS